MYNHFEFQDIAGIVYTIYESIGKSVVVPHCGSKTINVRLTVSPDSKAKPASATHNSAMANKFNAKRQRLKQRKLLKLEDDEDDSGSIGEFQMNLPIDQIEIK